MSRFGPLSIQRISRLLFVQGKQTGLKAPACLLSSQTTWNKSTLDDVVKSNKLVVFMKGTPQEPMCGFSRAVVQILEMHGVTNFQSYNILEDEELRQGVKDYSSWPTIPQVYINGEFVGGCDIMIEMHKSGDLIEELQNVGHKSALLDEENEKN